MEKLFYILAYAAFFASSALESVIEKDESDEAVQQPITLH